MSDIHALSGAYAVDALDDLERARFERHVGGCATCRAEVDSLREAAALLADTTETAPPPGLRGRVLADAAAVRPLPPLVAGGSGGSRARSRHSRLLTGLVAAAAVVAIGGVGVTAWSPWDDGSSQERAQPISSDRVLRAADREVYVKKFPDGARATVVRSPSLGAGVFVTSGMAAPPAGKTYELWLKQDEEYVPAGLFAAGDRTLLLTGDVAHALGAAVTVEPEAGVTSPTSSPVVEFTFEQA